MVWAAGENGARMRYGRDSGRPRFCAREEEIDEAIVYRTVLLVKEKRIGSDRSGAVASSTGHFPGRLADSVWPLKRPTVTGRYGDGCSISPGSLVRIRWCRS